MSPPSDTWRASGVVTFTTDFGLRDPYVGIMHGVVLSRFAEARVVDVTHGIPPQDVRAAAWTLRHAWRFFPPGTVHVAVVDPGVGSERAILVAEQDEHAFLAPDNGLLGGVLGTGARVRRLDAGRFALPAVSATFHGRDVFSPAAAAIASGLAPSGCGPAAAHWRRLEFPEPVRREDGSIETEVLLVDHFGNLISGFAPGAGEADIAGRVVDIAGRRVAVRRTYAEVEPGELVALVDSYGHLEVAQRDGDAARTLRLGRGAPMTLRNTP